MKAIIIFLCLCLGVMTTGVAEKKSFSECSLELLRSELDRNGLRSRPLGEKVYLELHRYLAKAENQVESWDLSLQQQYQYKQSLKALEKMVVHIAFEMDSNESQFGRSAFTDLESSDFFSYFKVIVQKHRSLFMTRSLAIQIVVLDHKLNHMPFKPFEMRVIWFSPDFGFRSFCYSRVVKVYLPKCHWYDPRERLLRHGKAGEGDKQKGSALRFDKLPSISYVL